MPRRSKQTRMAAKLSQLANKKAGLPGDEGKWKVKFTFDGKCYEKTHQLSAFEIQHMKELAAKFGDLAADQLIWKVAVKGIGVVSENVIAQAGLDYVKSHHVPHIFEEHQSLELENQPSPMDFEEESAPK